METFCVGREPVQYCLQDDARARKKIGRIKRLMMDLARPSTDMIILGTSLEEIVYRVLTR